MYSAKEKFACPSVAESVGGKLSAGVLAAAPTGGESSSYLKRSPQ